MAQTVQTTSRDERPRRARSDVGGTIPDIKAVIPLAVFLVLTISATLSTTPLLNNRYHSIFSFGDSLTDTGNLLLSDAIKFHVIGQFPFGETFFQHSTGRCSNGRLIVDFIADAYGLPFLPPYLGLSEGENSTHGVNFAVAGATALDANFFYHLKIGDSLPTNKSLSVQLGWFHKHKSTLCSTKQDYANYFERSLFLVGEIGGNDYTYVFFDAGGTIPEVKAVVQLVVDAIATAISMLVEEGAVELLVPGNLPIGCNAMFLTQFRTDDNTAYDGNGCLKAYNAFSGYHNDQLKIGLAKLRQQYPHARIKYADLYGVTMKLYEAPNSYGFREGALVACCGGGGPYNFNKSATCGEAGSTVCPEPAAYVNWDGIHFTENAYQEIAMALLNGSSASPLPLSFSPITSF